MLSLSVVQTITIWILPVLFAITIHEASHAFVANYCGDSTAKSLGRLSMNPLRHIDPIGTIVVPILVAVLTDFQFILGWAKPVPVNWYQLRRPKLDMALVAAAGPLSNIIMAFMWAMCAKVGTFLEPNSPMLGTFMLLAGEAGILINFVLAYLNLIPIPPLDGSRLFASVLSPKYEYYYLQLERFGFFIIFALLWLGVLGWLIGAPIMHSVHYLNWLFNI